MEARNVRFRGNSGHHHLTTPRLLLTQSGHGGGATMTSGGFFASSLPGVENLICGGGAEALSIKTRSTQKKTARARASAFMRNASSARLARRMAYIGRLQLAATRAPLANSWLKRLTRATALAKAARHTTAITLGSSPNKGQTPRRRVGLCREGEDDRRLRACRLSCRIP